MRQRDRALRRERHPRRPQHPRLHRRPVHVPERAAGAPLRHSRRHGPGVPARRSDRHAARRRAHAGQRPDGVVVRDAHLAGAARQVDSREPARRAAAAAAARRARIWTRRRSARRRRCASSSKRIGRIRPAPPAIGGWIRSASASRTSTPSAPGGRWTASSRSTRRARCPTAASSTARWSCRTILEGNREAFAQCLTTKLLTYALGRGLERYDTPTVKLIASRLPAKRLPLLGAGARDREQPAVPVATTGSDGSATRKGTPAP